MAFINAFQGGQQFQSLQEQRAQNLRAGEQNILIQQNENERADKSFALREKNQAQLKSERATTQERIAAQDQIAKVDRDRQNQLRATQNTVKFIKAGLASGASPEEVIGRAAKPLQALGVTPDQFGPLAQQIQQDPGVLDQFEAALGQAGGKRRAIGRPVAVRLPSGDTAFMQTFDDGSSEIVEGVAPLAEELRGRGLDIRAETIDPTQVGLRKEEQVVGGARGEIRAEDLPKGVRATARAKRATQARQERVKLIDSSIDEAIEGAGNFTTGFLGAGFRLIPGTGAFDLSATLDTIRANVGFDELQRLRDNSPTGGALGQVSERENILLQSVLGSIEQAQSPTQFKQRLRDLKAQFKLSQERISQAFEDDFGVVYGGPGSAIPTAQAAPDAEFEALLDQFAPRGQ